MGICFFSVGFFCFSEFVCAVIKTVVLVFCFFLVLIFTHFLRFCSLYFALFFLGFFIFFVYRYTYFLFHFFTWLNADLSKVLLKEKLRIRGGETAEFCSKIPKASPSHSACRMSGFAVRFLLYTMLFPLFFPVEAICRLFLSEGHFYWRSFALS